MNVLLPIALVGTAAAVGVYVWKKRGVSSQGLTKGASYKATVVAAPGFAQNAAQGSDAIRSALAGIGFDVPGIPTPTGAGSAEAGSAWTVDVVRTAADPYVDPAPPWVQLVTFVKV